MTTDAFNAAAEARTAGTITWQEYQAAEAAHARAQYPRCPRCKQPCAMVNAQGQATCPCARKEGRV